MIRNLGAASVISLHELQELTGRFQHGQGCEAVYFDELATCSAWGGRPEPRFLVGGPEDDG